MNARRASGGGPRSPHFVGRSAAAGAAILLTLVAAAVLGSLATAPARDARATDDPEGASVTFTAEERARIARLSPLGALPPDPTNRVADDPRAARLGERLFSDPRLSGDGDLSCASCHDPERDFADGLPVARGRGELDRNTPGLRDVARHRSWFRDGRATTLWGQAIVPVEDPREMAGDRLAMLRTIAADAELRAAFEELFGPWPDLARFPARATVAVPPGSDRPADPSPEWRALPEAERRAVDALAAQVGKVLAAYQRTLASGETPFDRFAARLAAGEDDPAYPAAARRGLALFVGRARCHLCHHGPAFTDHAFHAVGVAPRDGAPEDPGRYGAFPRLHDDPFRAGGPHSDAPDGEAALRARGARPVGADFGAFRTPGLRGVARTAPYMHAGQLPTLEAVVRFYSERIGALPPDPAHPEPLLEPLHLTDREVADLVAFLRTLSD